MSYEITEKKNNKYGIKDSKDGIVEWYSVKEIRTILRLGLEIDGVKFEDGKLKIKTNNKTLIHKFSDEELKTYSTKQKFLGNNVIEINWDNKEYRACKARSQKYWKTLLMSKNLDKNRVNIIICDYPVKDMAEAFGNHISFEHCSYDVRYVNTSRVEVLESVFHGVTGEIIGIENWDTSHVRDMSFAFSFTSADLNLEKWDTSLVENMEGMFNSSKGQITGVENWNVSRVKNMKQLFRFTKIPKLDLSNWNIENVENADGMFNGCVVSEINLSGWNKAKLKSTVDMFRSITTDKLMLKDWDLSRVNSMDCMFFSSRAGVINLENWKLWEKNHGVHGLNYIFRDCVSTIEGLETWDTSHITEMVGTFQDYDGNALNLENWITDNVTDMTCIFWGYNCGSLLGLENWNVSSVIDMKEMFRECKADVLDLRKWDVSNVTDMECMFDKCHINRLDIRGWNFNERVNFTNMFFGANIGTLVLSDETLLMYINNSVVNIGNVEVCK